MRIATIEDKDAVIEMAMKFAAVSPYSKYITSERMNSLTDMVLQGDATKMICFIEDGAGMIAGIVTEFPFGSALVCTELLWWVEPEYRLSHVGSNLMGALENWAKEVAGCSLITMVSLDPGLGKYYEKMGYVLHEHVYMKEFK